MTEYAFDVVPEVAPGRAVFRVRNEGAILHSLTLVPLPDDFPPLDEAARSDTGRAVGTLARVRELDPGESATFAADLAPGRYGLVCFVPDDDGVVHAAKGMNAEILVRSPDARATRSTEPS